MISAINAFSQNLEQKSYSKKIFEQNDPLKNAVSSQQTRKQLIDRLKSLKDEILSTDSESEKFSKTHYNQMFDSFINQVASTKDGQILRIGAFGMLNSGYSSDGRVTIWGKYKATTNRWAQKR